jgi:hypothetical protein
MITSAAPPHNAAMNIRLFLGGLRPPKPSQGPGPGCAGLRPASAEVWGNPVSPPPSPRAYVHLSRPCDSRTTPDEHRLGARASRPRRGSAGTVTAPSLTLPRWGREPGSSPQRGEAGRGAEPGERWSPQEGVPRLPRASIGSVYHSRGCAAVSTATSNGFDVAIALLRGLAGGAPTFPYMVQYNSFL